MRRQRMNGIFCEKNDVRLIFNRSTKNGNRAVLGLGTNSTRLLVANLRVPLRIVAQRSIGTRLGEGLRESGQIGEEPMRRTLEALEFHYALARRYTDDISVIATSAMRRADNAQIFIDQIVQLTSSNVTVLNGKEEASCSFHGAVHFSTSASERVGVLDVGGGSTEYATGTSQAIEKTVSCEVGAVRLTEWFPDLAGTVGFVDNETIDQGRERARQLLSALIEFHKVSVLIAVGGTATTSAAVLRGHRLGFGQATLSRDALAAAFNKLCELGTAKRRHVPGMVRQRADILPAGMMLLDAALENLGHDACTVSRNDLLLGYLLSQDKVSS